MKGTAEQGRYYAFNEQRGVPGDIGFHLCEINQCVRCEPASPRHRVGVALMAWRP